MSFELSFFEEIGTEFFVIQSTAVSRFCCMYEPKLNTEILLRLRLIFNRMFFHTD